MSRRGDTEQFGSLVALLRERADAESNRIAYRFLPGDEEPAHEWTYATLDTHARRIAAHLQCLGPPGARALILMPPGLDYLAAFFGCLYAGWVAVPAFPPRSARANPRLAAIAADARATVALTSGDESAKWDAVIEHTPALAGLRMLDATLDDQPELEWRDAAARPETLAFLQYTSGSTADPKGVVLTHANLLHNLAAAREAFGFSNESSGVSWLPLFHDMGLIGVVLQALYCRSPATLLSPVSFLQRPVRWLDAISRFRATASGGPISAYQLCVDRIGEEERAGLDLSSWVSASVGAEPIKLPALERFAEAFAPAGFRRGAFAPCYGLAEATLVVSANGSGAGPTLRRIDGVERVGCGPPAPDTEIAIVDPASHAVCAAGTVGEIWLRSPSVAAGYWERPDETREVFRAELDGSTYLRTGDLGALLDGELFVTDRLKDLIIVRGRNVFPRDVEASVEQSHDALALDRVAAFSVLVDGEERLAVVAEVTRHWDSAAVQDVFGAIRHVLAEEHQLQPHAIALLRHASLPRTSSGKVQRRVCRARYLAGELKIVASWVAPPPSVVAAPATAPTASAIEAYLRRDIGARVGLAADDIDIRKPFTHYGLDSLAAVAIAEELSRWIGRDVPSTIAWDHPTIEDVARYLSRPHRAASAAAAAPASRSVDEPVAVIGLGCRFPGGDGADAFWRMLQEGREAVSQRDGMVGGFLEAVDLFDARFFGITPREAVAMDPQQRLLLEVAWHALEDAGIDPAELAGSATGVFVGISTGDYMQRAARIGAAPDAYLATGNAFSVAANRLSYVLGLRGPSMAIDTACSSSLVAVHLACQSLRAGEVDVALVGGVNLLLAPETSEGFAQAQMLAGDGRCKTFSARADGYGRGEGCAVVVLRRLSEAVALGDDVLAVVRGSAVNQDGRSNGLTAPSGPAQEEVIRAALARAGVEPATVAYVEAHGTGTPLGDPIELRALANALGPDRSEPLLVGSVKTNIGHLEAAAGIAGFAKAVLSIRHGEVPPHLNAEELSPHVPWAELPLTVATGRRPLRAGRRLVGVSSFGFGGTNAHVVLDEPPALAAAPAAAVESPLRLVKLTAHGEPALREAAARLAATVVEESLAGVAYSANVGRADLPDRAAAVVSTTHALVDELESIARGGGSWRGRVPRGGAPKIAFVVPGQGARAAGALSHLYGRSEGVTRLVGSLAEVLGPVSEPPLAALLESGDDATRALAYTTTAQPALYALALALAEWWREAGVVPDVVLGHSVGAYAAAALAGLFAPEEGARLVAERGRIFGALSGGAMSAVLAAEHEVAAVIDGDAAQLAVAAINAPAETVLSGSHVAVARAVERLGARGIRTTKLEVSHAFHSPLVEPALGDLEIALAGVRMTQPARLLVSDHTGAVAGAEITTPGYWLAHARDPVRFAEAVRTARGLGCGIFVELGAAATLLGMVRRVVDDDVLLLSPLRDAAGDEQRRLLECVAQAWTRGAQVDWRAGAGAPPRPRRRLPSYPFQGERFWLDADEPAAAAAPLEAAVAEGDDEPVEADDELVGRLRACNREEARVILLARIREEIGGVTRVDDPRTLADDEGLFELGVDSLMAVELQRRIERAFGRQLSPTLALDHPTIGALAGHLLELVRPGDEIAPAVIPRRARDGRPVAIVGMACRFPGGADDLDAYWRLLRDGVDAIGTVPASRWDADLFYDPDPDAPLRMTTRSGGFIRTPVDEFDADAFRISPREAAAMDPQQRLLLEVAAEALDDAGIPADQLAASRTGVFVGINTSDYLQLMTVARAGDVDGYAATGNTFSVAAGRLSYVLGLQGPSIAVDTACSSSLVATHLALQSLQSGECDVAVVAGVNLMLSPATTISLSKLRALSPDGRCKTFDAAADGYGRGEGCGVVVLRREGDAALRGDRVWALVRGSAVNHDGRSAGLTVPNGPVQEALIREALAAAQVGAADLRFVEAHGTGTALGDPIELQALANVLGERERPLLVGSVKTNIGHLEAAAGIAGLIKVALSLSHRQVPRHLHFREPSPIVPWERLPVEVPTELRALEPDAVPAVAGVSSFGFSGTNAHVVLEEPPPAEALPAAVRSELLVLSARSPDSLRELSARYDAYLAADDLPPFADVCFTASTRRTHFEHRLSLVAASAAEARERLGTARTGQAVPAEARRLIFVYSGQGGQWPGMGAQLLDDEPAFTDAVERCDELARSLNGPSPLEALRTAAPLEDTAVAQPVLLALQVGLTELWRAWGVLPQAVVGHSVGEIAAAWAAGVLTLDDAMRIAVARGRLMQPLEGGGKMAALGLAADLVHELLEPFGGRVCVAGENSPRTTVVSGTDDAVDAVLALAAEHGIFARALPGRYAFHSSQMAAVGPRLAAELAGLEPRAPRTAIYSTVTGDAAGLDAFGAAHWAANVTESVLFAAALRGAGGAATDVVLELGPGPILASSIAQTLEHAATFSSLRTGDENAREAVLEAAGGLHTLGVPIDHGRCYAESTRRVVTLPAQPWRRRRFWLAGLDGNSIAARGANGVVGASGYAFVQRSFVVARPQGERYVECDLSPTAFPYLLDHGIDGAASVVPVSVLVELVLAASRSTGGTEAVLDLTVLDGVVLGDEPTTLQLALAVDGRFEIYSGSCLLATGALAADAAASRFVPDAEVTIVDLAEPPDAGGEGYVVHPLVFEACVDALATAAGRSSLTLSSLRALHVTGHPRGRLRAEVRLAMVDGDIVEGGVTVQDGAGVTVLVAEGMRLAPLPPALLRRALDERLNGLFYELVWLPVSEPAPASSVASAAWLLLGEGETARELARQLEAQGQKCTLAGCKDASAARQELLPTFRGVVDLRFCDRPVPSGVDELAAAVATETEALLELAQTLAAGPRGPRLWVVTRGAQPVAAEDVVAVEQAPLWGLGRVIALEHPEIWGGLVDLGVDEPATSVAAELLAASDEDQVAYRGGVRHGLRLTPTAPPIPAEPRLRADGSYLITGGRGALGVRIADWLVEHGARHLILTGRAAVPQRQHWGAELRRLEERGATVRLVSADVGDERAMAEVLDVHPPVRGIVHAAGVFEPQALATMTPEELRRVLRPKVRGTAVLDRLTRGRDLDFFVLFSSAAAVWGSALAAHYVAANHFEDAVAHARRRAGEPALSVDWGWWAGSEMVPAEAQAYFAAIGLDVIPEQLGFAALERLLASDVVQQTVAPVDWRRFKPVFEAKRRRPLLDLIELPADDVAGTTASTDGLALLERLRRTPGAARREIAVQFLQTEVGVVLGRASTDLVDPQLGFFEAGMDSITAVELKGRLETTFGIVLPATAAFEYPNVVALAEYLVDAFGLEDAVEDGDRPLENLSEQDLLTLLAREVGAETVR